MKPRRDFSLLQWLRRLIVPTALMSYALSASTEPIPEYALRSVVLYKIAKFIEWPADAFADATSALVVCVVGDELATREFKRIEQEKHGPRPIMVRRVQGDATDLHRCHIAYFQASQPTDLTYALRKLHSLPVLTVGESKTFLNAGGSIALLSDGSRVSFAINQPAASANGLRVSSQLLHIASRMNASK